MLKTDDKEGYHRDKENQNSNSQIRQNAD